MTDDWREPFAGEVHTRAGRLVEGECRILSDMHGAFLGVIVGGTRLIAWGNVAELWRTTADAAAPEQAPMDSVEREIAAAEARATPATRRAMIAAAARAERELDAILGRFESILGEGRASGDDYRDARCLARSLSGHAAHLEALADANDRLSESETAGHIRSLDHARAAGHRMPI